MSATARRHQCSWGLRYFQDMYTYIGDFYTRKVQKCRCKKYCDSLPLLTTTTTPQIYFFSRSSSSQRVMYSLASTMGNVLAADEISTRITPSQTQTSVAVAAAAASRAAFFHRSRFHGAKNRPPLPPHYVGLVAGEMGAAETGGAGGG